jgi:FlaA1/EpsC-like NDP-sugar epimerase
MTTREAALLITESGAVGTGGEIFMLDMGQPLKIVELARHMIKLSGLEPDIDIPITFGRPRPGEKIFEEIFSDDEKMLGATQWDKIFITKSEKTYPYKIMSREILRLEQALKQSEDEAKNILNDFIEFKRVAEMTV